MKTLYNPTDNKVKIAYKGAKLEIEPQSESEPLSDEQINYWTKIHSFLMVKELTVNEDVAVKTSKEPENTENIVDESGDEIKAKIVVEKKKSKKIK